MIQTQVIYQFVNSSEVDSATLTLLSVAQCYRNMFCIFSALIFPPFNSFHRFLAHKCTEDYKELKSFSIGQGILRRLVICDQADFVG